jgi:hypothetical protein
MFSFPQPSFSQTILDSDPTGRRNVHLELIGDEDEHRR